MKFAFTVGTPESHRVEFSRSALSGTMSIKVDGKTVATKSAANLGTHFSLKLTRRYTFTVGTPEQHQVTIEHQRPLLFAGFRPQTYRVFVDGEVIEERTGY
jgi:hypothetical protein